MEAVYLGGKLFSEEPGRGGLEIVDETAEIKIGRQRNQQVDMIRFPVELGQFPAPALATRLGDRAETIEHWACECLASVFCDDN